MPDFLHKRRRLRFRLRTLLLLPLVFAAGWWWVTWPERTARRFVELLKCGETDAAQTMLESTQPLMSFQGTTAYRTATPLLPLFRPTSWLDVMSGRRRFDVTSRPPAADGSSQFVAVRGYVVQNHYIVSHWLSRLPADAVAELLMQSFADRNDYVIATDRTDNRVLMKANWDLHIRTLDIMMELDPKSADDLYSQPTTISAEAMQNLQSAIKELLPPE